jgi:histidine triad (HIT) family protein
LAWDRNFFSCFLTGVGIKIGAMKDCVFCKIVAGEIPAEFVYQDEEIAVFPDIKPFAPVHLLYIPKKHIGDLTEAGDALILKIKAKILEKVNELGLMEKGYRIVINGGTAKAVPHLHFHLLGEVGVERTV